MMMMMMMMVVVVAAAMYILYIESMIHDMIDMT